MDDENNAVKQKIYVCISRAYEWIFGLAIYSGNCIISPDYTYNEFNIYIYIYYNMFHELKILFHLLHL
ncbi:MAG: hypothetical protein C3F06_14565 [Candidatus Methanoperedenaceae archaeon]|nr:MAG: hypothetical protein C3F06_14565 [Candidatus Methanoperedenaceae archaeon]